MKNWTKEEALKNLQELANDADHLGRSTSASTEHVVWITKSLTLLEEVFGPNSRYYLSFHAISWHQIPSGTIINPREHGGNYQAAIDAKRHEFFLVNLGIAKGLLLGAVEFLKQREMSEVYSAKDTPSETSLILKVLYLAEHNLRKAIKAKPEKEIEVQDAFENILIGAEIPYTREAERIQYSSKTYTPDFSLPKISLAIDLKFCNRSDREKEIIAEINDDVLAYQTIYPNLLFIVYDLGFIRDVERFCGSFQELENVSVKVVKH